MMREKKAAGTSAIVTSGAFEGWPLVSNPSYARSLGICRLQRDFGLTPHLAAVIAELAEIGGRA